MVSDNIKWNIKQISDTDNQQKGNSNNYANKQHKFF